MAALLEKIARDHRLHPVMTRQERDETYGVQVPKYRRRSLPPEQRNGHKGTDSHRQEQEDMEAAVQTDPLSQDQAEQKVNTGKITPIKQRTTTSGQLPLVQQQGNSFWIRALIVLGLATLAYTLIFLVAFICIGIGNLFMYGPIHTAYTTTTINGQPARIITSNDSGDITVTIKITQKDGTLLIRSYAGPVLNPDMWNGDLAGIVATPQVGSDGQTITVHLLGQINYFHPFFLRGGRPEGSFSLVPDKQAGYKIST
jgi:hypothetical protein